MILISEPEDPAKHYSKLSALGIVKIGEPLHKVDPEKPEDIFYSVRNLSIGFFSRSEY